MPCHEDSRQGARTLVANLPLVEPRCDRRRGDRLWNLVRLAFQRALERHARPSPPFVTPVERVRYEWDPRMVNGKLVAAEPRKPGWAERVVGTDYIRDVIEVSLDGEADAVMPHIGRLARLRKLELKGSKVSDAALVHLRGLIWLKSLDLASTPVSDAGLPALNGLTRLKQLDLSRTAVTDAGLAALADNCSGLEALILSGTPITDAGLEHLSRMRELQVLWLESTSITDRGAEMLGAMGGLIDLDLANARIGDAGLAHLARLPRLLYLQLERTAVTSAGLGHVRSLSHLRLLGLSYYGGDERRSDQPIQTRAFDPYQPRAHGGGRCGACASD